MIKTGVIIRHVDSALSEYEGTNYWPEYQRLKAQGLDGKPLLDALISDDVGPRPRFAEIVVDGKTMAVVKYE